MHNRLNIIVSAIIEDVKKLFLIEYSEVGSLSRHKEEQAWILFCDFLDDCESTCM